MAAEAARRVTFEECAQRYFAAHADSWSSAKHRDQFAASLRNYVYPIIGALPVAAIDEALVLKVLTPIWREKTVTAGRVRNRIASVLDYAAAAKYRTGTNPARWEGHLEHLLAAPDKLAVRHHTAMLAAELPAFLAELRTVPGSAARALEFLILTAARTGETIGATWDEIDLAARTWTIPRERMKAAREHVVPLAEPALALLRALPREDNNPFLFIGVKAGSAIGAIAMLRVLQRLRPGITVHGFRSTFSTWAHEATSFPAHVIELSLAHTVGTAVERAYRRSDLFAKRRRLLESWTKFCASPPVAGDVVPLRAQRS